MEHWKKFENNNPAVALNMLHGKEMDICLAYISKCSLTYKKQMLLLMIPNVEKDWHYLSAKKLSTLLHGVTSKH